MARVAFVYLNWEALGIEYLSSYLKSKGHETSLFLDPRLFQEDFQRVNSKLIFSLSDKLNNILLRELAEYAPDLIGFSVTTDQYQWALEFAGKIKKAGIKAPIIFGGIHPSSVPELVIKRPEVDIVCVGEGEEALLELAENVGNYKNGKRPAIKNLWFKYGNEVVKNDLRMLNEDLDSLPFPDKDMFYRHIPEFALQYNIISGRGCPFKCTYCCNNHLNRLYKDRGRYLRRRGVDNVIEELVIAKQKYKPPLISFRDEVFAYDLKWIKDFSAKYREKINIPFKCYANPGLVSEELVAELKKAGLEYVAMGVQTVNENSRKNILHRFETNEQVKRSIEWFHKYGISVNVDHIAGIPGEGLDEMIEAVNFYKNAKPDVLTYFWLTLYPGTDMVDIFKERNMITDEEMLRTSEGLGNSDFLGGNVKENYETFKQFRTFLSYLPLMPVSLIDFILKHRLYRYMAFDSVFFTSVMPRLLKVPSSNDFKAWVFEIGRNIGKFKLVFKKLVCSR
jgi:radical SAM superfamily enzyme YgiQ (UPF0313 family)